MNTPPELLSGGMVSCIVEGVVQVQVINSDKSPMNA